MVKKLILCAVSTVLLLLTSACQENIPAATSDQTAYNAPIELNVSAALGLKEALLDIQKEYEQSHPTVKFVYNLAARKNHLSAIYLWSL